MVKHCVAFGCSNRSGKADCKDLSWHSLPLGNKKLLAEWLVKIRCENTPITKHSHICSQHFEPECFIKPLGGQRVRLKPGSVPTKFVFTAEKPARKKPCYRALATAPNVNTVVKTTVSKALLKDFESTDCNEENNESAVQAKIAEPVSTESDETVKKRLLQELKLKGERLSQLQEEWKSKEQELNNRIKELEKQLEEQINARKELEMLHSRGTFNIETVKENDKLFRFYTGFESYSLFTTVLDFLGREAASRLDYRTEKSTSEKRQYKYRPGPNRLLSVETEFFITLCRLKVGLLEDDLAARFGVSQSFVSLLINTWIKFLFYRFKELNIFPSREIVKLHMPECFAKKYPTTTLIVDATEIYIEKPSNPEAQQLTFSSYKNTNTLKALIGIVPKGGISFVSTLYGGSISDKELTARSGLVDKLQSGDVIMADRGFNIHDMLATKGVRVNVPPFMNESGQFDEGELLETRRIATLRIHVERAMERIKNYHILDFIPITLCRSGIIDMIFFVCAMLANFHPPLVEG